ncbi:MAG: HU family DNA-binding protein [Desulfohalobiaceae bacterium]|nr:HU family DNA-binding protein [Desulfohalobiaceae bacterium]
MTKANLINKIADKTDLTKADSERALNACLESIQDILVKEGKLTLTGFGTFAVDQRQERKGRNPQTGAPITIPAAKVVKFRPGKVLKDSIK